MATKMYQWQKDAIKLFGYKLRDLRGKSFNDLPAEQQTKIRSIVATRAAKTKRENEWRMRHGLMPKFAPSYHPKASKQELKIEEAQSVKDFIGKVEDISDEIDKEIWSEIEVNEASEDDIVEGDEVNFEREVQGEIVDEITENNDDYGCDIFDSEEQSDFEDVNDTAMGANQLSESQLWEEGIRSIIDGIDSVDVRKLFTDMFDEYIDDKGVDSLLFDHDIISDIIDQIFDDEALGDSGKESEASFKSLVELYEFMKGEMPDEETLEKFANTCWESEQGKRSYNTFLYFATKGLEDGQNIYQAIHANSFRERGITTGQPKDE